MDADESTNPVDDTCDYDLSICKSKEKAKKRKRDKRALPNADKLNLPETYAEELRDRDCDNDLLICERKKKAKKRKRNKSASPNAEELSLPETYTEELQDRVCNDDFEYEPMKSVTIDDIIDEVTFQDNTLAFNMLLSSGNIWIIVYPPGSGKTTMATLLHLFLSSTTKLSEKMTTFFDNCNYARSCKADFDKFRKSGNVAYISFETIRGETRKTFEESLSDIMLKYFQRYLSNEIFEKEEAMLMDNLEYVYTSLCRFVLKLHDNTKTTYLLLDSCDTVYNAITLIGHEAAYVCMRFTNFLRAPVPTVILEPGVEPVKMICFGASPFFAHEFSGKAKIHDIRRNENDLGQYFSYSIKTIDKVIEQWKLPTSSQECVKIAGLHYNNRNFINPAICVSFLRSLHMKKKTFQVDLVPRSLWLGSIFTPDDRDLLLDILSKPCKKEFSMCIGILSLITDKLNRKLFYPLFVYGGFLSCVQVNKKFKLSIANETARCFLEKSLNGIYFEIYNRGLEECGDIYKMIINDKWQELCDSLSRMLSTRSTRTMSKEHDYNNWLEGLLNVSKLHGFSIEHIKVKNNAPLAGLFPDITSSGSEKVATVWELKLLQPENRYKIYTCSTLDQGYNLLIHTDAAHKLTVLKETKKKFKAAALQIAQYARSFLIAKKYESAKCFIPIFYLNHVTLFVKYFHYRSRDAENIPYSRWEVHCSDGFFSRTDLEDLALFCNT